MGVARKNLRATVLTLAARAFRSSYSSRFPVRTLFDGRRLYASNATSDSIDVLAPDDPLHPGELQNLDLAGPRLPLSPPGATIFNTTPFQFSLSSDDDFLYVLNHEATDDD